MAFAFQCANFHVVPKPSQDAIQCWPYHAEARGSIRISRRTGFIGPSTLFKCVEMSCELHRTQLIVVKQTQGCSLNRQ